MVVVLARAEVAGLEEREGRELRRGSPYVGEEAVERRVAPRVLRLELVDEEERLRDVARVDLPGDVPFVQPVVDRVLVVPVEVRVEDALGHLHPSERRPRVHEERLVHVGPGTEACQASHTRKLWASAWSAGSVPTS